MDTISVELPLPETEALYRAIDQVLAGGDAVISGSSGLPALLDGVAHALAQQGCRVLRASSSSAVGLSLSGLMAQITGRPDLDGHDDEVLERGFQALTAPNGECSFIALLVDGAEALQRTALRYLQFTCRSAPALRFVLAGDGGVPFLQEDEMTFIRTRLAASPMITLAAVSPGAPVMALQMPAAAQAAPAWALDIPPAATPAVDPVPLPPSRPRLVLPGPAPSGPLLMASGPSSSVPPMEAVHATAARGPAPVPPLRAPFNASPAAAPLIAARKPRQNSRIAWAGIAVGMAASIGLGVIIGRHSLLGSPDAAPMIPVQAAVSGGAVQGASSATLGVPAPLRPEPPGAAAGPAMDPGHAAAAVPSPSRTILPGDVASAPPVEKASPTEALAIQPPSTLPRVASQPDTATTRAKPLPARSAELRSRDSAAPWRNTAPRFANRSYQSPERPLAPPSGQEALYLPPLPSNEEWQPPQPEPPQGRPEERRQIIGTYTTDQHGVRTFKSNQ